MNEEIIKLLDQIEVDHHVTILYACESGSRAWGFASEDSDFDIRFLFKSAPQEYLRVFPPTDTINLPLIGDLDASGWDIRKALGLLGKSNGSLLEWLHSPIVYRAADGFLTRWQKAARDVFSQKPLIDHYRGLAKQMIYGKLQEEKVRAKDYLYALRSLLCAEWIIADRGIPPVPFAELIECAPDSIIEMIPTLLTEKAKTKESERMEKIPALDHFLQSCLMENSGRLMSFAKTSDHSDVIDSLYRHEIFHRRPERAEDYTLERVRRKDTLLFETIAGSYAYGTQVEESDQDLRGVFVATPGLMGGLDAVLQVTDERNDEVYYELGRFMELLLKNNPNALELLAMPADCIRDQHPAFAKLRPEIFLSKLCEKSFGEYAMTQIRKARGLNKKIVNPQPEQRLSLLSFCHVPQGQGSAPLLDWLHENNLEANDCGLTAVRHAAGVYAIFHAQPGIYRGLVSKKDRDALVFSSVPIDAEPIAWMHCNIDAFKAHVKAHTEYWQWVKHRNEERYTTNASHGQGYDSKNLMHTIRLLEMAREIAREGVLRIRRPNFADLLRIRAGEFSYESLVQQAEELHASLAPLYACSSLPDTPDRDKINELLVEIREAFF